MDKQPHTKTDIDRVARLAGLAPDEAERRELEQELGRILDAFQAIQAVDTKDVAPLYHPLEQVNTLRPDDVQPPTERGDLLAPASRQKDGCLLVPRTVT
ncbi:MAG: Asp-tRNA(Asn)/Glu-tRNA(Gln) amidotransferase subunit GatC [Clostridiaceae bacterium]|jgi:aspartyl-tRNA(Asn)/glutamyl-tRNA(Gln) amidotransferase subunit C|nr:Asp-tRNA(Asn)/Glu-tRNA(Gln) amidotransferase subunit GatC [Clostridiaceae bacterium]